MKYLISTCLLIVSFCSFGQKELSDIALKHTTKQDGLSLQFYVLDPEKKGVKHHNERKIYYWHKAQKVMSTQGGSAGQLLHGSFESFYPNKQLCQRGSYCKGLKDGDWSYWTTEGVLEKKEHWSNGVQKGEQLVYTSTGEVQKRILIHGRKSRMETADTLVEIIGPKKAITVYDSLGAVVKTVRYKSGKLHGKQVVYSDGKATTTTYRNGGLKTDKKEDAVGKQKEKTGFGERVKTLFKRKKDKSEKSAKPEEKQIKGSTEGKKEKKTRSKRKSE